MESWGSKDSNLALTLWKAMAAQLVEGCSQWPPELDGLDCELLAFPFACISQPATENAELKVEIHTWQKALLQAHSAEQSGRCARAQLIPRLASKLLDILQQVTAAGSSAMWRNSFGEMLATAANVLCMEESKITTSEAGELHSTPTLELHSQILKLCQESRRPRQKSAESEFPPKDRRY
eukprot:scaffold207_cov409-Prasinococcus_capsulatus_cf.AAC.117